MKLFETFKLHYLPRIAAATFLCASIISYLIAVRNNHVRIFLPFISECGMFPPESCIFGQFLNVGAVLLAIIGYIRYQQVNLAINSKLINLPLLWNKLSFWTGNIVCMGISIVANFQARSSLFIHLIGAAMVFGTALVYFVIELKITASFAQTNRNVQKSVTRQSVLYYLRIFLTIVYFIAAISTAVLFDKSVERYDFEENIIIWNKEDTDLRMRTLSAISEWVTLFVFIAYSLTMAEDFKFIECEEIRFKSKYAVLTNKVKNKKVR